MRFDVDRKQNDLYNLAAILVDYSTEAVMSRSILSKVVGLAFGVGLLVVAPMAFAQASAKASEGDGGYGYEFSDDPLNAGGFGPSDATIRVRPTAARTTLIRPRISFVQEMLKSVENI